MTSFGNRSLFLSLAVLVTGMLAMPRTAQADTINLSGAGCLGLTCTLLYPGGTLTLTSDGGDFMTKSRLGATGLGVSGDTRGEIDVNETIRGEFSTPVTLDGLSLLYLFNGPEFGDPNEVAQVSINGGSIVGTLTGGAENTAVWSLGGGAVVTSCGATNLTGTGCFMIANPFGSTLVSDIAFTAVSAGAGLANDSDFSVGSLEVSAPTPTPEPGTMILLGSGALLIAARRKRRASRIN